MPYQVNGIGTTYLGKQNLETRQGVCEFCGRSGVISSYDTRLWFTFLFVPLIPLSRKRILDDCAVCLQHRQISESDWKQAKTKATNSALAELKEDEDNAEKALGLHGTFVAFGEPERAHEIARFIRDKHADHLEAQLHLFQWYEEIGDTPAADECLRRASEIDPNHPAVVRATAIDLIRLGDLDQAREKLAPLEPPAQNFEPSVFFMLAEAYQKRGQHEKAAELLKMLQTAQPELAKNKAFRKAARASEKQVAGAGEIVPRQPLYKSPAFVWSGIIVAVLAGLLLLNFYRAGHRQAFLVNGLNIPISVKIDEQATPFEVNPHDSTAIALAEGKHRAQVVAPAGFEETVDFEIRDGFAERWFSGTAVTIDPTRSAVVNWECITYAVKERDRAYRNRYYVAEPFLELENIDYPFEEFPEEIDLDSAAETKDKTGLTLWEGSASDLAILVPSALEDASALDFYESHLRSEEDRRMLLSLYFESALKHDALPRCREFLEAHLEERPIDADWHRAYQHVSLVSGNHDELVRQYDSLLETSADDSQLLYLRGRLEPNSVRGIEWFDRAIKVDSKNAYAHSAKASELTALGRFDEALVAVNQALQLDPDLTGSSDLRRSLLLATGEDQVLESELRAAIAEQPIVLKAQILLMKLAADRGDLREAEQIQQKFDAFLQENWSTDPHELARLAQFTLCCLQQDFTAARRCAQGYKDQQRRANSLFETELMAGNLAEAGETLAGRPGWTIGYDELCLSLAYAAKGSEEEARRWRAAASEHLAQATHSDRLVSLALDLSADDVFNADEFLQLSLEPKDKVIVLIALADQAGDRSEEMLALAEQLNLTSILRAKLFTDLLAEARDR